MDEHFEHIKQLCIEVMQETKPCEESEREFREVADMDGLLALILKYWYDVIGKAVEPVVKLFHELYDGYIDNMHSALIFFNEDANRGRVLVYGAEATVHVGGQAQCFVSGKGEVEATGRAKVYCTAPDAIVTLRGDSYGNCSAGTVKAIERSHLTASCDAYCKGFVEVNITHGTLRTEGHKQIIASGDAVVRSFTDKAIDLSGNAQLIIE